MNKLIKTFLSGTLFLCLFGCQSTSNSTTSEEKHSNPYAIQGKDLQNFDLYFLKQNNNEQNEIYSPLSIKNALSMLLEGANGQTKQEIADVLGQYEISTYTNSNHISIVNGLFINNKYSKDVNDSYIQTLQDMYQSDVYYDSFTNPDNVNQWISDNTYNLINNFANEELINSEKTYFLANALAIDMDWNRLLQATPDNFSDYYNVSFKHEKYQDYIPMISENNFEYISFNNHHYQAAEFGSTANRYDLIEELGEDNVYNEINDAYLAWLDSSANVMNESYDNTLVDRYINEIKENYNQLITSTDFKFYVDDDVKVFAKDLQEYDGTTLEYVAILPKQESLTNFIENSNSNSIHQILSNLKDANDINSYKNGVVTKIIGATPFFEYDFEIDLKEDLKEMGITSVFNKEEADLSNIMENTYIEDLVQKSTITLSNEGIKAAAISAAVGGLGAGGSPFQYDFDVPIEIIDLEFNQPFMYLIQDKSTHEIWFVGTVYEGIETNNPTEVNSYRK